MTAVPGPSTDAPLSLAAPKVARNPCLRPTWGPGAVHVVDYDVERWGWPAIVASMFGLSAPELSHVGQGRSYPIPPRADDQDSPWHRSFYREISCWADLFSDFASWCAAFVFGDEDCHYQAVPSFRLSLPGSQAVGEWHTDADYGHPEGEVTIWVPLTPAWGSNAMWIEVEGRAMPVSMLVSQVIVFDAVQTLHGNVPNMTGHSRMSFDFRIIPKRLYREGQARSINTGKRFAPGEYYA